MNIKPDRIKEDIEAIFAFNATPGQGFTRFSFSAEDRLARDYLTRFALGLGLEAAGDFAGNVHIRYPAGAGGGRAIMFGSHLDTVLNGGRYDGLVGVAAAMEVLRVLTENSYKPRHPLAMIAFAEEEGSNFGLTMLGSKLISGALPLNKLPELKNRDGQTADSVLNHFLGRAEPREGELLRPEDLAAFVELHVEQSGRLERRRKLIGLVETISGLENYRIIISGQADHAGSTPMADRRDALAAASAIMADIYDFAAGRGRPSCVATVGALAAEPNIPNIVSGRASFTIDFRSSDESDFLNFRQVLEAAVKKTAEKYRVGINCESTFRSAVVTMSEEITRVIAEVAEAGRCPFMRLHSGAVHDSASMARIAPAALIFIPSRDGKSHCPQEYSSWEDIAAGAQVMLETIIRLDQSFEE